ncbi:MAG TPA: hypothetical protein VKS80_14940 [Trinickia sp.]|nr:hypothetical protein [Trinickia sp.]
MKQKCTPSLVTACVSAALICATSFAADDLPEGFNRKPTSRFVVSDNPYYKDPQIALKNGVAANQKNHQTNRFCVVGYQWQTGSMNVWVLWKEEEELLLWDGALDPDSRATSLIGVRRDLKLGRDTVKTEHDINGSTYLVTEQWWHAVADDCMKHGEKYVIKPFKVAEPVKPSDD